MSGQWSPARRYAGTQQATFDHDYCDYYDYDHDYYNYDQDHDYYDRVNVDQ